MQLEDWNERSGVYFITTDDISLGRPIWVKVGMAKTRMVEHEKVGKGLGRRIDSYLLYYPLGFKVLCIITTLAKHAGKVEKMIHNVLRSKMRQMETKHSHSGEWFTLTRNDIEAIFYGLSSITPNYMIKSACHLLVDQPWIVSSNYRRPQQTIHVKMDKVTLQLHNTVRLIKTTKRNQRKLETKLEYNKDIHKRLDFDEFQDKPSSSSLSNVSVHSQEL
jgi:hypothetical protein